LCEGWERDRLQIGGDNYSISHTRTGGWVWRGPRTWTSSEQTKSGCLRVWHGGGAVRDSAHRAHASAAETRSSAPGQHPHLHPPPPPPTHTTSQAELLDVSAARAAHIWTEVLPSRRPSPRLVSVLSSWLVALPSAQHPARRLQRSHRHSSLAAFSSSRRGRGSPDVEESIVSSAPPTGGHTVHLFDRTPAGALPGMPATRPLWRTCDTSVLTIDGLACGSVCNPSHPIHSFPYRALLLAGFISTVHEPRTAHLRQAPPAIQSRASSSSSPENL